MEPKPKPIPTDEESVVAELLTLEDEEQTLSAQRQRLHEIIDNGNPNELLLKRERQISDERLAIHARITLLRARLTLIRGDI